MSLIKISPEEAKNYIPLKENYGNKGVENAKYFTLTPSPRGDGWDSVTYYTAKKLVYILKKVKAINGFMFYLIHQPQIYLK